MKKFSVLYIALFFVGMNAVAQVPDSVAVDSLQQAQIDSLRAQRQVPDTAEIVIPWREGTSIASSPITNDSLLRWQIWPNWGDYQAYRNDVIAFRQGTVGRVDAFHINGYLPDEQQLRLEGIDLGNPITGLVNYNLVPHHKISEVREQQFGNYQSNIKLRDYYITQPISYLNYDESKYLYRNLEFMVTQNLSASTNVELSYWDRRDGDYYPNNEVTGSQIFGKVYHHLSRKFQVRALYLRNQFNRDEPFGYTVGDPATFSFDRFSSPPRSSNGKSDYTRWDLITGLYHRPDTNAVEDAGIEAFISKNKKSLSFSGATGDTLSRELTSIGARVFKDFNFTPLKLETEVEGNLHKATDDTHLDLTYWAEGSVGTRASYDFREWISLFGTAEAVTRDDSKSGYEMGGGVEMSFLDQIKFTGGIFRFNRIPQIQAMYWQSKNFTGNPDLANETGTSLTANLEAEFWDNLTVGLKGRHKNSESPVFLSTDSSFVNGEGYTLSAATLFGKFENHRFEISASGTYQTYEYSGTQSLSSILNFHDEILWIRNAFFVKGYAFDRAAYIKTGLKTVLSPSYNFGRSYNPELDFWYNDDRYQRLMPYFRMDAELSARVRSIMVVLRWENVLDGLGQAGYFEAAGYPMPPRRLIIGIRARFLN